MRSGLSVLRYFSLWISNRPLLFLADTDCDSENIFKLSDVRWKCVNERLVRHHCDVSRVDGTMSGL